MQLLHGRIMRVLYKLRLSPKRCKWVPPAQADNDSSNTVLRNLPSELRDLIYNVVLLAQVHDGVTKRFATAPG